MCEDEDGEGFKTQLLSRSSVAVSTSQDFDDNATITAFWGEKKKASETLASIEQLSREEKVQRFLLFQSPWHRVCLFCVCTPD